MFCMLTKVSQSLCQFSDRLLHLIKGKVLVDLDGGNTFTAMRVTHRLRSLEAEGRGGETG